MIYVLLYFLQEGVTFVTLKYKTFFKLNFQILYWGIAN